MLITIRKKVLIGILGIVLIFYSIVLAETWSKQYINSLPDSSFAIIEVREDGKRIRHLPHHDHNGELDIPHLKSALGRIHQVKWIDPANFEKAKKHLEDHYNTYKMQMAKAHGLKGQVNINKASVEELMRLPHIGEKLAKSIVEYRNTNGNFKNITELENIPGITSNLLKEIEDLIAIE